MNNKMKVPILKGTISAIISASVSKFYGKASNKESLYSGLLTGASTIITDTLFNLTTFLPSWFSMLGLYGQDFAAALLDSGFRFFAKGKGMAWTHSNGGFVADFLISLGSNVLASYVEMPIASYLPDSLSRFA